MGEMLMPAVTVPTATQPPADVEPVPGRAFVPLAEAARRLGYAETRWRDAARLFPVRWPVSYLELAESEVGAPVRRMGVPEAAETVPDPGDLSDPVGEALRQPHPFIVQKHADRVILIVTARCHFYCRFCFRRAFPGGDHRDPSRLELDSALGWVRRQPAVTEVILSGGDPLVLTDERLGEILATAAGIPHVERLRVHTRAPVHFPERVTPGLVRALSSTSKPCRIVVHANHAVELTDGCRRAIAILQAGGLPVLNQSVLLRGVNDTPEALVSLVRELVGAGVTPYYLHHPDPVPGNASFRVPLREGQALVEAACRLAPGLPWPLHVVDLPDGSGKVPVASLVEVEPGTFQAPSGLRWRDPAWSQPASA